MSMTQETMDLRQEQSKERRREVYSNGLVIESKNGQLIAEWEDKK